MSYHRICSWCNLQCELCHEKTCNTEDPHYNDSICFLRFCHLKEFATQASRTGNKRFLLSYLHQETCCEVVVRELLQISITYVFWKVNIIFLKIPNHLSHPELRICSFQTVVITSFIISNVGIKRAICIWVVLMADSDQFALPVWSKSFLSAGCFYGT